jgi:hypothetical protein
MPLPALLAAPTTGVRPSSDEAADALPQPVLLGTEPMWVGVPERPEWGQVVLYRDASGQYVARTGSGRHMRYYALRTQHQGTAVARVRDWLQQTSPPMHGILGRSSTAHIETALRAFGVRPDQVRRDLATGAERAARNVEALTGARLGPVTTGHASAEAVVRYLEASVLPPSAQGGARLWLRDLFGSHRYYTDDRLLDRLDRAARDASGHSQTLASLLDHVTPGGAAQLARLRAQWTQHQTLQSQLRPRFATLFSALEAWTARPADTASRSRVNEAVWAIESRLPVASAPDALTPAQRDALQRARKALASAAPSPASETPPNPGHPWSNSKNWIYENLQAPNQYVYPLWEGPHDYIVRVVMDQGATAMQPASVSLKATLAAVGDRRAISNLGKVSVRYESSSLKTSTGTKLQFGYDVTRESESKRREYRDAGEPVMDLISIETKFETVIDRLRGELGLARGARPNAKLVVQQALALGGYVRWRRVWEDPKTGAKTGVDLVLGMKTEGSVEAGLRAAPGGVEGKADIELTYRYFGPTASAIDPHHLEAQAAQAVAELLWPERRNAPALETRNFGSPRLARQRLTAQLMFGTSVWQLAPQTVSAGKNHGHQALDLAIRTNRLLHAEGALPATRWVTSTAEAAQQLRALWQRGRPEQRAAWARGLANPMSINFGLADVAQANRREFGAAVLPQSGAARYRKLFLEMYRH